LKKNSETDKLESDLEERKSYESILSDEMEEDCIRNSKEDSKDSWQHCISPQEDFLPSSFPSEKQQILDLDQISLVISDYNV